MEARRLNRISPSPPSSMAMHSRMAAILLNPTLSLANQTCADCPATDPQWVSFLYNMQEQQDHTVAVLCCSDCAQHHHFEVGEKRCHLKYLQMTHEWYSEELDILQNTGNAFVNAIYEANFKPANDGITQGFDKNLVLPCYEKESHRRGKFIKDKYKKLKFRHAASKTATSSSSMEAGELLPLPAFKRPRATSDASLSPVSQRVGGGGRRTKGRPMLIRQSSNKEMRDRRLQKIARFC